MKPLELTSEDIKIIISSLGQSANSMSDVLESQHKLLGTEEEIGEEIIMQLLYEIVCLQAKLEAYHLSLNSKNEFDDDLPDNVIKFNKDKK
tara:strand:- start:2740 stop:3012 length:273 start_codon:yes stop_codon:yes gene_type:complete